MYSNIKSVQLLISALKSYNIQDIVLSPGGSDIPIIHSIENDGYFHCYSVVDERSSVYFGMGLSQSLNKPVACVCTSGTAVSNYLPGLTEAYYQNVPIIAITADKNPYFEGQIETQKINQMDIFKSVCKKEVDLPIVSNSNEEWYCSRLIRETLFELNHHGSGPVHINIPIIGNTGIYEKIDLPQVSKINLVKENSEEEIWKGICNKLSKLKKILVVVGENSKLSESDVANIEKFFKTYNCLISSECISNIQCQGTLNTYPITEMRKDYLTDDLLPDLVISCGNNVSSYHLKPFIRKNYLKVVHWTIDEGGRPRDTFKCLDTVFECSASHFFEKIVKYSDENENTLDYYNSWHDLLNNIKLDLEKFSNLYVASKLAEKIPKNSILHLAILNSTRVMQFFKLDKSIKVYSNVGALGIDGCLSTFMGQSNGTKELAFCLIGDLSFFYDMNAAGIKNVHDNVRIVLLNNGGGSEFHFFMGKEKIPTINNYICAAHTKVAEGWIKSLGYKYYAVKSKEEFEKVLPEFISSSKKPIFIEVFTNMEEDASNTKKNYDKNQPENLKKKLKKVAKNLLNDKQLSSVMKMHDKMKR